MIDLTMYYILPNIALFGGLYTVAKAVEIATWNFIVWYTENN
jgi:hypothetical protein